MARYKYGTHTGKGKIINQISVPNIVCYARIPMYVTFGNAVNAMPCSHKIIIISVLCASSIRNLNHTSYKITLR